MQSFPEVLFSNVQFPFSSTPGNAVNRSDASAFGQLNQINRFTTEIKTVDVQFTWSDLMYGAFRYFFTQLINNGADYFNLNLPMGDGLSAATARFVEGKYQSQFMENKWVVTAQLELQDFVFVGVLEDLVTDGGITFVTDTGVTLQALTG